MGRYIYHPLTEKRSFRVLYLHAPYKFEGPIQGELREAHLDRHPEYEALSYSWESPIPTEPILCAG